MISFSQRTLLLTTASLCCLWCVCSSVLAEPHTPDIPAQPAPDATTQPESLPAAPESVFVSSELRDGILHAQDAQGREWVYNFESGAFTLAERVGALSENGNTVRIYYDGEDTIRTDRDRPEGWAQELMEVPRTTHGDITVGMRAYVSHRIATNGAVRIDGLVDGNVISTDEIVIGKYGWVEGDVTAPSIRVRPGGVYTGDKDEEMPELPGLSWSNDDPGSVQFDSEPTEIFAIITIAFLFIAFISATIAPNVLNRTSLAVESSPWKTFGVGCASLILLAPTIGAVAITVIGIPIAIAIALLYPVAAFVGLTAAIQRGGQILLSAYGKERGSQTRQILIGGAALFGLWLLGISLNNTTSDFLQAWGGIAMGIAGVFSLPAFFAGLGGIILTKGGRKDYIPRVSSAASKQPPPPTPPPINQPA